VFADFTLAIAYKKRKFLEFQLVICMEWIIYVSQLRKICLTNPVNRIMLIIYRSEVERGDKNRINVNCLLAFNKYQPELIRDFWLILYFLKVILPAVILKRFHFMARH